MYEIINNLNEILTDPRRWLMSAANTIKLAIFGMEPPTIAITCGVRSPAIEALYIAYVKYNYNC